MSEITLGSKINIKVVKQPNAAASKTIARILARDKDVALELKRLKKVSVRHYDPRMRGGRLYGGQVVKQHPIKGVVGESGTILATVDILPEINSVARFVEVTPA